MIVTEDTAHAIEAWIAAATVVVAAALILALLAWVRVGRYMRQCRGVVQCYAPRPEPAPDTAERYTPLAADRITEDTQEFSAVDDERDGDEYPTGRHAFIPPTTEPTELMPAAGALAGPPAYYFAEGGEPR